MVCHSSYIEGAFSLLDVFVSSRVGINAVIVLTNDAQDAFILFRLKTEFFISSL